MKRQVSFLRHTAVLLLAFVVFALGIFIGGDVEQLRVQNLYDQLQNQDLEYRHIATEAQYISYLLEDAGDASCDVIKGSYFTSIANLDDSRVKLENYIAGSRTREEEFDRIRSHYFNLQITYWLLGQQVAKECNSDIHVILYFYSDDDKICPECEDQGVHLGYVKQRLQDDVLIFSFDVDEDGPVQLLKQRYEVTSRGVPTVVIDGDIFGFITNQEILELLEA